MLIDQLTLFVALLLVDCRELRHVLLYGGVGFLDARLVHFRRMVFDVCG